MPIASSTTSSEDFERPIITTFPPSASAEPTASNKNVSPHRGLFGNDDDDDDDESQNPFAATPPSEKENDNKINNKNNIHKADEKVLRTRAIDSDAIIAQIEDSLRNNELRARQSEIDLIPERDALAGIYSDRFDRIVRTDERSCCEKCCFGCGRLWKQISEACSCPDRKKITSSFVFGIVFDMFQIALSVADVATDILVAREFYQAGHMPFFALMCTTLTITSISNAIGFLVHMGAFKNEEDLIGLFLVVPFSVIGLLLPITNYVMTKFDCLPKNARGRHNDNVDWDQLKDELEKEEGREIEKDNQSKNIIQSSTSTSGYQAVDANAEDRLLNHGIEKGIAEGKNNNNENKKGGAKKAKRAVLQLFIRAVAPQQSKLALVDKAISDRIMTYLIMNLQSVSQSMPSSIIQLIAISIFGDVTSIQIISLCLSLFSLACKSFILCRSFTVRAFFAKIFNLSFDLFSMAFIFSCLLATNTPRDSALYFGLLPHINVNVLSNIWITLKTICLGIWILTAIATWIYVFTKEIGRGERSNFFFWSFMMVFCTCMGLGPALIVEECLKLSWIVWFNHMNSPHNHEFPNASLLHEFLHGGAADNNSMVSLKSNKNNNNNNKENENDNSISNSKEDSREDKNKNNNNNNGKQLTEMIDWPESFEFLRKYSLDSIEKRRAAEKEWEVNLRKDWAKYHRLRPAQNTDTAEMIFQHCQRPVKHFNNNNDDDNNARQLIHQQNHTYDDNFYSRARHVLLVKRFMSSTELAKITSGHYRFSELSRFATFVDRVKDVIGCDIPEMERIFKERELKENANKKEEGSLTGDPDTDKAIRDINAEIGHLDHLHAIASTLEDDYSGPLLSSDVNSTTYGTGANHKINKTISNHQNSLYQRPPIGFREICTRQEIFKMPHRIEFKHVALTVVVVTETISTLYSFAFFIIYGALYIDELAIMQKICFFTACVSLFFSILLAPSFWSYMKTCFFYATKMAWETHEPKMIMSMINSYFSVPLATLQVAAVPNRAVPEDAFAKHVLPFLTTNMVGLYGIVAEDFADLYKLGVQTAKEEEERNRILHGEVERNMLVADPGSDNYHLQHHQEKEESSHHVVDIKNINHDNNNVQEES